MEGWAVLWSPLARGALAYVGMWMQRCLPLLRAMLTFYRVAWLPWGGFCSHRNLERDGYLNETQAGFAFTLPCVPKHLFQTESETLPHAWWRHLSWTCVLLYKYALILRYTYVQDSPPFFWPSGTSGVLRACCDCSFKCLLGGCPFKN